MKAIIYKIENLKNGKIYIGSTTNYPRRKKRHWDDLRHNKHHSLPLQRSWNKYGEGSFTISKIEKGLFIDKETLLKREQFYMDTLLPEYNVCKKAGSQLGSKRSDEFKKRCSDRMKGKPAWNKGLKLPKQSKETIRKRTKNRIGKHLSTETKLRIKGKVSRKITQWSSDNVFIKEWDSAKQISKELPCSYTAIVNYINGKSNIKTFKGFIWKRLNQIN